MSSSDRRQVLFALAALPVVAACGFTPAFGPGGAAAGLTGRIDFDPPTDRNAYDLVEHLETRLGRGPGDGLGLTLGYRITLEEVGLAITPENATARYNVTGTVAYVLKDREAALDAGEVTSFTSYSATSTAVATKAARRDAYLRLMRILGDQIVTRLIAR